jgi:hypothetical protein
MAKRRIAHHLIEGGRFWQGLTRLTQSCDVPAQSLTRHSFGSIECRICGDTARKIGKADTEVAVGLFADDSDVIYGRRPLAQFQAGLPFG